MISADRVRAILADLRKLPYLQIMVGDWLKDEIATCSPEARDLWWHMMLAMHTAPLYGHLCDAGGRPLREDVVMAKCLLTDVRRYRKALSELDGRGVPSRSGDDAYLNTFKASINGQDVDLGPMRTFEAGVIYSRRMVRDHRLRVIRRLAGALAKDPETKSPVKPEILVYQNQNLVHQIPDANARARAETETDIKRISIDLGRTEGVQGEARATPDFAAAAMVAEKIRQSALREFPPDQVVVTWVATFGRDLILETLMDCEADYAGKGWQYLRRILETRLDNPSLRPSQRRRGRHDGQNGNGGGNGGSPRRAEETRKTADNPLGNFGMRNAADVLEERAAAKRKLQEMQEPASS